MDTQNEEMDPNTSVVSAVMSGIREKLKVEDEDGVITSPFAGLQKSSVLQEATTAFNDPQVVKYHPQRCCLIITKLLFLLSQGESFNEHEASGVFFAVTKLFQSQDLGLRRMTYLFIKEVAESTDNQEIIIVTASLTKDMNSGVDLYRANSIRVLCKIIDSTMLGQIERYIKQAVVDRNALIASSALVSGNQMVEDPAKREIVRRWVNEVQEAVNSRSEMVQYHALSLAYNLKVHDKLAINKLVSQLTRAPPNSPLAMCLLVRYAARLLYSDLSASNAKVVHDFLESCLRHKNEMVVYEAARSICKMSNADSRDLQPAISVLQNFLSSPKPTMRFAAVRTLNQVAMKHPLLVTKCNDDMEALIADSNRSIATLATTTLLKTGQESSIDRLMKQISNFMSEIADEFKIVVVRAIRTLCIKYPQKNRVLLNFLSTVLREEGGFDFKKVIVDTILDLMQAIPETKESGLFHLCEFIEDCEFSHLSAQILHVLGEIGPTTKNPAKYIRFIYNRVILENAHVRAAAASSLGVFAARVVSLRPSVVSLLNRCLTDEDDEVRDRATIALALLKKDGEASKHMLVEPLPHSAPVLLRSLEAYKMHPTPGPVTFENLPIVAVEDATVPTKAKESVAGMEGMDDVAEKQEEVVSYSEELMKIPQFATFGPVFKSSKPVDLTEPESEYLVRLIKHVFNDRVVLQFNLTNTLNDLLLANVNIALTELDTENWTIESAINVDKLPYNVSKKCYIVLKQNPDGEGKDAEFETILNFNAFDVDPESPEEYDEDQEGFPEVYDTENVEIATTDFVKKLVISDFKTSWDTIGKQGEAIAQFELAKYKTVDEAVTAVIDSLQMQPCEGTAAVASDASTHTMLLAGTFLGDENVLIRTKLGVSNGAVVMKIAVRSSDAAISESILDTFG